MSDAALHAADRLEPMAAAVTYKSYRPEQRFLTAETFMDTSLSIIDPDFKSGLERYGFWRLMERRPVVSLACDVGPAATAVDETMSPNGYPRYRVRGSSITEAEYLARATRNVAWLRTHYTGALRLENLNYFSTESGAYDGVCEPGFLTRLLEAIDAELVLDVAHAFISCTNLMIPSDDYFAALPLHRVREVQISGRGIMHGILEDLHDLPGPSEWDMVKWLSARANVQYVTIEYYRDSDRLVQAYRDLTTKVGLQALSEPSDQ